MIELQRLDHLVLTVRDIDVTCEFYSRVLGMEVVTFGTSRRALRFGQQKINLHAAESPIVPHAMHPTPGSADLCLVSSSPMAAVLEHLAAAGVFIAEGPVPRTGAVGPITSVYFRDPDLNLIEIAVYEECHSRQD